MYLPQGTVMRKAYSWYGVFIKGMIHWWQVNSPHKRPVTRRMFPFDDVIMKAACNNWTFEWKLVERSVLLLMLLRTFPFFVGSVGNTYRGVTMIWPWWRNTEYIMRWQNESYIQLCPNHRKTPIKLSMFYVSPPAIEWYKHAKFWKRKLFMMIWKKSHIVPPFLNIISIRWNKFIVVFIDFSSELFLVNYPWDHCAEVIDLLVPTM